MAWTHPATSGTESAAASLHETPRALRIRGPGCAANSGGAGRSFRKARRTHRRCSPWLGAQGAAGAGEEKQEEARGTKLCGRHTEPKARGPAPLLRQELPAQPAPKRIGSKGKKQIMRDLEAPFVWLLFSFTLQKAEGGLSRP